ncbi:MAG: cytochrome c biogenesis CcdA family protein [Promethearchaeota archaeon]
MAIIRSNRPRVGIFKRVIGPNFAYNKRHIDPRLWKSKIIPLVFIMGLFLSGFIIAISAISFFAPNVPFKINDDASLSRNYKSCHYGTYRYPMPSQNSTTCIKYNLSVYYFYNLECSICQEKLNVLNNFLGKHKEIENSSVFLIAVYSGNKSNDDFAKDFLDVQIIPYPVVIFEVKKIELNTKANSSRVVSTCKYLVEEKYITNEILESIYTKLEEEINLGNYFCEKDSLIIYGKSNYFVVFLTGILSGLSPCIILITAIVGGSFLAQMGSSGGKRKMFLLYSAIFFTAGILIAYLIIGLLFINVIEIAESIINGVWLKLVFGIPLMVLGFWYIVDYKNEGSRLFKTPEKVKKLFAKLVHDASKYDTKIDGADNEMNEENINEEITENGQEREQAKERQESHRMAVLSMLFTFLLGFAFTFIKSPCVAGILLSIIYKTLLESPGVALSLSNPIILNTIVVFSLGIVIPIAIIFILLGLGLSSEKIDQNRRKIRPYLRLVSGITILITTLTIFL